MVKQIHLRAKGWNEISRILSSFDRRFAADVAAATGDTHNPTYTYYHTQRTTKIIFIYFLGWNIFSENLNSYASSDKTSCHGIWRLSMMAKYVRYSAKCHRGIFSHFFFVFVFVIFKINFLFRNLHITFQFNVFCIVTFLFAIFAISLEDIYSSME